MQTYKICATEALKNINPLGLNPDGRYSIPRILRTKVLTKLRAQGVTGLSYNREDSIVVIANAFPEGNEWLKTFREGVDNIGDLVETLHYHHGVEVLTMFFCLFGDAAVLEYRSDFIDQRTITLQHDLKKHVKDHGVVPHPAVLLKNHFPLCRSR